MKSRQEITKEFSEENILSLGWEKLPDDSSIDWGVGYAPLENSFCNVYYIKENMFDFCSTDTVWFLSYMPNNYGIGIWKSVESSWGSWKNTFTFNLQSIEELKVLMKQLNII